MLLSLAAASAVAAQRPAAQALDTVLVSASRTTPLGRLSRSITVVSRADIAASPARTVGELLGSVMGVDVNSRSPAQADVSIRGSTSDQILVLVDGAPVSDVQSSHYAFDLAVPLEAIERIEILRGGASAVYGANAVGGMVNIVTRRGSARTSAEAHGGSFGSVGGAVSGATGGLNVAADFDKSDGHRDGTDFRIGRARIGYAGPAKSGELTLDAGLGIRDFGAADFYAPYNSIERTASTTASSRWLGGLAGWTLDVSGNTRRHQDHYVLIRGNPSVYENHHEGWQSGASITARHAIGGATAAVGADAEHDQLSSFRLGGRREWRSGAFAEVSAANGAFNWNFGARGDHSSAYGDYLSPSASVGFDASSTLRLHASAGSGFRAPTWTERYYTDPSNAGNPNLAVERFTSGDAGATLRAALGSFDVTTYSRRAHDLIDWIRPAGSATSVWRASNIGDATIRGVEASLESRPGNGVRATVFATGLRLDASEGAAVTGKYALRPVTRQLGARLASDASRTLSARLELISARRANENGYTTGSVRIAWNRSRFRLTLDAVNLANAMWLDASGKPAAPRAIYAGVGVAAR
jgi:vitamin B12 transporter